MTSANRPSNEQENTTMPQEPPDREQLEQAARAALAERYGRPLTDEEWAQAKYHLLALARLVRDWHQKPEATDEPG